MQNDNIVFLGKGNEFLIPPVRRHGSGRIVGIGYHHQTGSFCGFFGNLREINEVIPISGHRHIMELGASDGRTVSEDRIAGIRYQHHLPLIHNGKGNVSQSFLGSQKGDHLMLGINLHAIPAGIPVGSRLLQGGSVTDGVYIAGWIGGRLDQRFYDMGSRRNVGCSHTQVHNVPACSQLSVFFGQQDGEDSLTEAGHSVGKFHSYPSFPSKPTFCWISGTAFSSLWLSFGNCHVILYFLS